MRDQRYLVLAIFVLSGAAGLVYEIVWSRQLVLVFGNTTQAVSAILTGFFGGMAIGAAVGGRVADRVRSPLRLYGVLELLLVLVVMLTPFTFELIREVYRGIYPSIESTPWLGVVRVGLAVLALGPATVMMGATFPSLTRHLASSSALSQAFGRLYSANTIGAIIGTLAAGYILIELAGLTGALAIGAACSGIAGVTALWLDRSQATADAGDVEGRATPPSSPPASVAAEEGSTVGGTMSMRLPLVIAFISGMTSLGYQVTWTRLLSSGTGAYTYVFTTILALFLVGIAIGASLFNLNRHRIHDPVRVLAWSQVLVALLAIAGLVLVIASPDRFSTGGVLAGIRSLFLAAIVVVLPVTIVLGLAFPTASALLRDRAQIAGAESGSLLAVNTVGAILGSLLVPFVLMPTVGSPTIIVMLALVNAGLGLALALYRRPVRRTLAGAAVASLVVVLVLGLAPSSRVQPTEAWVVAQGGEVFDSTEDEIASVQAGQVRSTPELWVSGTSMTLLTVDAKMMPILPLIARPAAERALVVAFGMGTAFRSSLIAGLRTDAVELVPSVPDMFGWYYPDAPAVVADPDGRIIIADGRNHLELSDERFDIIVTDPPPPIESSGVSVISSKEYYESGRDHLAERGVMMQWVPYGAAESELKDHIRTFAEVFPFVTIYRGPGGYGFYMMGSDEAVELDPDVARQVLERPGVLEDISSAYDSPASTVDGWLAVLDQLRWLQGDEVVAYAGDGPLITDDRPRPEYFLLRQLYGVGS